MSAKWSHIGLARGKEAFTVVEVLVTLGIIGLLAAIIAPAVQSARETSRNLQCCNHLKQIGLAFQNYESDQRAYPTVRLPLLRLGPYLEVTGQEQDKVTMFVCPSDARSARNPDRGVSYLLGLNSTERNGMVSRSWASAGRGETCVLRILRMVCRRPPACLKG